VEDLSFEAQPPSRAVFRRGDVFMDNKLESDRGSHCSISARQGQYPKRLKNGPSFDSGQDAAGPSKKRLPELRPCGVYPVFTLLSAQGPNAPSESTIYKDAEQRISRRHSRSGPSTLFLIRYYFDDQRAKLGYLLALLR